MRSCIIGTRKSKRIECSSIKYEMGTQSSNHSIIIKRDLNFMDLVAGMSHAEQMLHPVFNPTNRSFQLSRKIRNDNFLWIHTNLWSKSATHFWNGNTDI